VLCPATGTPQCFPDQEHIAADTINKGTDGKDQVYIVFRALSPAGGRGNCPGSGPVTLLHLPPILTFPVDGLAAFAGLQGRRSLVGRRP
jgi:hypothetical protein